MSLEASWEIAVRQMSWKEWEENYLNYLYGIRCWQLNTLENGKRQIIGFKMKLKLWFITQIEKRT